MTGCGCASGAQGSLEVAAAGADPAAAADRTAIGSREELRLLQRHRGKGRVPPPARVEAAEAAQHRIGDVGAAGGVEGDRRRRAAGEGQELPQPRRREGQDQDPRRAFIHHHQIAVRREGHVDRPHQRERIGGQARLGEIVRRARAGQRPGGPERHERPGRGGVVRRLCGGVGHERGQDHAPMRIGQEDPALGRDREPPRQGAPAEAPEGLVERDRPLARDRERQVPVVVGNRRAALDRAERPAEPGAEAEEGRRGGFRGEGGGASHRPPPDRSRHGSAPADGPPGSPRCRWRSSPARHRSRRSDGRRGARPRPPASARRDRRGRCPRRTASRCRPRRP